MTARHGPLALDAADQEAPIRGLVAEQSAQAGERLHVPRRRGCGALYLDGACQCRLGARLARQRGDQSGERRSALDNARCWYMLTKLKSDFSFVKPPVPPFRKNRCQECTFGPRPVRDVGSAANCQPPMISFNPSTT